MIYITYENEIGQLQLNGGRGHCPWHILAIEGLGLVEKEFQTASYPVEVGERILSETVGSRTITVQCDIREGAANRHEISKAMKILNVPGTISLSNGYTTYKIGARCAGMERSEHYPGCDVFAIQFICENPYFEDPRKTVLPILKTEELIGTGVNYSLDENGEVITATTAEGTFDLPCMLSVSASSANVFNYGDVDTEPVIIVGIYGELYTDEAAGVLRIENSTTGQAIELVCGAAEVGDTITIDIPQRKIYNQRGEDLISCLSASSFLSDFHLGRGSNQISVSNLISTLCSVTCEFSNKYVEAVIV